MDYKEAALIMHKENKGKLEVRSKVEVKDRDALSTAYTPGVAQPCLEIARNPEDVYTYTCKGNMVAVVSDGTAVLGLGNIGAKAAIPVMEGKAILFKEFAGVDAFPICLDTTDTEEIIQTVKRIAPVFGGINLEDISAPRCLEIERRLEEELDIPVFHDDQHGTAIVVTAALLNALKVVHKEIDKIKLVLNGAGSAGGAICRMLLHAGVKNLVVCDKDGVLYRGKEGMPEHLSEIARITNPNNEKGLLKDAVVGADVFIGVSAPGVLTVEMAKTMAKDAVCFAMANPNPEITYEDARQAGIRVIGTGRSDYPNQINNVLCFPGLFRGALDARARNITYDMKLAAARAIASLVSDEDRNEEYIIPSAFDKRVAATVADYVAKAARKEQ
ncbi:MAG: NADP-dependent malic enzyme [Lachnospiraceae bacterium]